MYLIPVEIEEILTECPVIADWITVVKDSILKTNKEPKIEAYLSYGIFVPKSENNFDMYSIKYEKNKTVLFPDRLTDELSKVRVDVTLKIGKFVMSNRIPIVPKTIEDIVTEITKVKMMIESEDHKNQDVIASIPKLSSDVKVNIYRDGVLEEFEFEPEENLDIDSILEKISNTGMDSLTDREKEFLDHISKNM